jgi:predicted regulator of Ras-like GTPase activity (Roadblock/LC7/MglB family)
MKIKNIKRVLNVFNASLPGIEDSAVILSDGMMVASELCHNIDKERMGTISAALYTLAATATNELKHEDIHELIIKSGKSYFLILKVGGDAVLVVITNNDVKLDDIIEKAKQLSMDVVDYIN